jgi:hypothetical protein
MTTWLIRRSIQAMPVALVMTAIVIFGLRVIGVPVDNRSRRCARSHLANAARPIGRNQNRPDVLRRHRPAAD